MPTPEDSGHTPAPEPPAHERPAPWTPTPTPTPWAPAPGTTAREPLVPGPPAPERPAPGPRAPGLLCVHAHPDDESITTGGILARYADDGVRTAVVTCTAGELGEIRLGDAGEADRARLGEIRAAELARALAILGTGPPRFLGYRDSGMPAGDHPGAFWHAHPDDAIGRLVAHVREFRPDVVVTYDAYGLYGHPDHLQAHRITLAAAEAAASPRLYPDAGPPWQVRRLYLATFPLSFITRGIGILEERGLPPLLGTPSSPLFGTPDERITAAVDVRPWLDRKWSALQAHATQVGPGSVLNHLPEDLRAEALGTEWFIRVGAEPRLGAEPAAALADDLFAKLR